MRLCGIAVEVEATPIPIGILIDNIAKLIEKELSRLRSASQTCPAQLGARFQALEQDVALRIHSRTDYGLRALDLSRSEAIGRIPGLARQHIEINVAGLRVLDESIFQSIVRVACIEYPPMDHRIFVGGDIGG